MFHACVERFDVMCVRGNILGWEGEVNAAQAPHKAYGGAGRIRDKDGSWRIQADKKKAKMKMKEEKKKRIRAL
jgi:hypothetical protein